jgi:predicted DNA-binding protein
MGETKRNYKKEREREKEIVKRYIVRVPKYMANALDEKLKKEDKTYSSIALEAIEKYLKKI